MTSYTRTTVPRSLVRVSKVVLLRKSGVCSVLTWILTLYSDSSMNPEDLASQSVRLKEEQLRREEEKLREIEVKVQREINEKRQELLARESQLKEIEARMNREQSGQLQDHDADEA
jgi:septin family protein